MSLSNINSTTTEENSAAARFRLSHAIQQQIKKHTTPILLPGNAIPEKVAALQELEALLARIHNRSHANIHVLAKEAVALEADRNVMAATIYEHKKEAAGLKNKHNECVMAMATGLFKKVRGVEKRLRKVLREQRKDCRGAGGDGKVEIGDEQGRVEHVDIGSVGEWVQLVRKTESAWS